MTVAMATQRGWGQGTSSEDDEGLVRLSGGGGEDEELGSEQRRRKRRRTEGESSEEELRLSVSLSRSATQNPRRNRFERLNLPPTALLANHRPGNSHTASPWQLPPPSELTATSASEGTTAPNVVQLVPGYQTEPSVVRSSSSDSS